MSEYTEGRENDKEQGEGAVHSRAVHSRNEDADPEVEGHMVQDPAVIQDRGEGTDSKSEGEGKIYHP